MKAVSVTILAIIILLTISIQESSAQVDVTEMIKIGEGRYWMPPTTRNLPVYVRTAGNVVGRNWWKVGLSWGSVVLVAGSVAIDIWKSGTGVPAIDDWLASHGLRGSGTGFEKSSTGYAGYEEANAQAAAVSVRSYCSPNGMCGMSPPGYKSDLGNYATYAEVDSAITGARNAVCGAGWTCTATEAIGAQKTVGSYVANLMYIWAKDPGGAFHWFYGVYVTIGGKGVTPIVVTNWNTITDSQAKTEIDNKINASTGNALDKGVWEWIEQKMKDQYDTAGGGGIMDGVNPANGKTAEENLKDAIETAISGETGPDKEGEGFLEQIYNLLKSLFNTTVTDPADPGETDSTETIIGQEVIDQTITAEKEKTEGFLDDIMDSIDGLKDTVNAKITALLGAGGTCSVLSETVYGSEVSIDFCDIDWSTWRVLILAVAALAACLIVLGVF